MLEIRLAQVLFVLFRSAHSFALNKGLIVGTRGDLVWLDFVLYHFLVELAELVYLFAGATRFKHPSVYDFDVSHGLKLLADILQFFLGKIYEGWCIYAIDGQCRTENLEEKKVNDFHIVSCPLVVMHLDQGVIRNQLSKNLLLHRVLVIVRNRPRQHKHLLLKFGKYLVVESLVWINSLLVRRH